MRDGAILSVVGSKHVRLWSSGLSIDVEHIKLVLISMKVYFEVCRVPLLILP